ncbi:hypothetical protein M885DRAFT_190850 [Pelagophyceae sp. CCMP2097]|nr:hypothetical protein M885DRAFT_190850 [Pelagophyceae sp. CCMP2097]
MDEVLAAADAALLERTNDAIMLTSKKHAALAAGKATFVGGAKGKAAKGAKEPPAMDAGEVGKKTRAGSTLIIDRATALFPRLARLAAVASGAFGLPANINLYCTAANLTVSVPAHNDAQDTLLMQFEGRKRWVLYTPQSKVIGPHATDGMLRGKGDSANAVPAEEVQQIALDVVLEAGDLLYVPRGMVHATSTELAWVEGDEAYSIHGTLALETDVAQATVSRAIICAAGLAAKDGSAEWSNYQEKMYFLQTFHAALQRADQSTRRDSAQLRRTLAVGFLASLQPSAADATMLQRVALSVVIPWSQDGDPKLRKDDLRRLVKGHHYEAAVATILNGATELQGRLASAYASFAHEAPKNAKELRRRQLGVLANISRVQERTLNACGLQFTEASAESRLARDTIANIDGDPL